MLEYKLYNGRGDGDYLILLHGMGGSMVTFYKQIREYRRKYRVLAIHLPGHGNSPSIDSYDEPFSFELAAREIVKLMDYLNIENAHFIGASLGSALVHTVMQIAPDRVKSAVLGGALTRVSKVSKFLLAFGHSVKSFVPFMWLYILLAHLLLPKSNHKEARAIFIHEARKMKRSDFLGWYKILHTTEDTYKNIREKTRHIPKLYISGTEDHLFVQYLIKDVSKDESAKIKLIEKCGHNCNIERADKFNKLSMHFWDNNQEIYINTKKLIREVQFNS